MILSPEGATRAIGVIIVPAVMISACAILLNGITIRYTAIDSLFRSLNQESFNLKRDRSNHDLLEQERIVHLDHLIPKLLNHHHLLHNVLTLIYLSLFIFVVDMLLVAASLSITILWVSYLVLGVFLAGIVILCWSLFLIVYELRAAHDLIQLELRVDCDLCTLKTSRRRNRSFHSHFTHSR